MSYFYDRDGRRVYTNGRSLMKGLYAFIEDFPGVIPANITMESMISLRDLFRAWDRNLDELLQDNAFGSVVIEFSIKPATRQIMGETVQYNQGVFVFSAEDKNSGRIYNAFIPAYDIANVFDNGTSGMLDWFKTNVLSVMRDARRRNSL